MRIFQESKIVWKYLRPYRREAVPIMLLALVNAGVAASIPYIYGRLVDAGIASKSVSVLLGLILMWLSLSLVENYLMRFIEIKGGSIAVDAGTDLFLELSDHSVNLPLLFHKSEKAGKLGRRIHRASEGLEYIIDGSVFYLLPATITLIAAFSVLFFINWMAASLTLLFVIVYAVISVYKVRPILRQNKFINRIYEEAFGHFFDSLQNIAVIKSYATEGWEAKRRERIFRSRVGTQAKRRYRYWAILGFWQRLSFDLGFLVVFAFAVFLLSKNVLTPGEVVMFIGYFEVASRPVHRLAWNYRQFRDGMAAIERGIKLLRLPQERRPLRALSAEDIKGDVEFENVSFAYEKGRQVLNGVSFRVKAGSVVALVGESGVGKSTIVDLLSRHIIPAKGRIYIDARDIKSYDLHSLREKIAVVPQDITLFNDTIKNNIKYANRNAGDEDIIEAAKAANAHEFIIKFAKKYNQLVGERGVKLSAGQKQRVAIARAILRNPKIFILDEATSALDSISERLVQDALQKLIRGRTTFIIAHRLSTIQHADVILVLKQGRIVEKGSHGELVRRPGGTYAAFYKQQLLGESAGSRGMLHY